MLVSTAIYQVYNHQTTAENCLSVPNLVGAMQETAYLNVAEIGVMRERMAEMGMAWVMLRFRLRIHRLPSHRETFTVQTYPSGSDRYFFYRDFKVGDEQGAPIASAVSSWILIDLASRKPKSVPDFVSPLTRCPVAEPLPQDFPKLQPPANTAEGLSLQAMWHDIDVNNHVNNGAYIRWILESVPVSQQRQHSLQLLDINFRLESKYGDRLFSCAQPTEDGKRLRHAIRQESSNKTIAIGLTEWA